MRKLFFIVCCFLVLDICIAQNWWENHFIIGAHWGPSLHYKYNNVDSPLVRNFTLLKDGGFNFIVGPMNIHNNQTDSILRNHVDSLSKECEDSGIYFLNEANDPHIYCGVNIKDEPAPGDESAWLGIVNNLKQTDPDKLGFINLYPSYSDKFSTFNDWKNYVDAYLGNTTLQVACFDNYDPHSQFSSHKPDSAGNYYSNLAYMKQVAGSRPLWAYLKSSEKFLKEENSAWQDAYIRLGAFAPLAFGAKGIIYFCYDCQDRNKVLRSPGRSGWHSHDMYFDNEEESRQIFFGNLKRDSTSLYPDLAIHTNDSIGTWRIKETDNSGIDNDQNLLTIGTWFGDHIYNMPNLYNWDFTSDGYDKFTTITLQGRLHLSMFRNGWTHYCNISNFPSAYWSTMSRHTCPFGDFNGNKQLDYCLGWTENGQGKLWILMDCHLDPSHTPTPRNNPMLFDNTSQTITFNSPLKQAIAKQDSLLYVITSAPSAVLEESDTIYKFKYDNGLLSCTDTARIVLAKKIDHYWMEETLCGQSDDGDVWEEYGGQAFNLTHKNNDYSSGSIYLWGQYNTRSHQYDRYAIVAEGATPQSYALLNRKGNPNRIYYTAQSTNQFINDNIRSIIMDDEWLGAYFSSPLWQKTSDLLNIIKGSATNPCPLISKDSFLSDNILFGLFEEKDNNNLNLLVINMCDTTCNLNFTFKQNYANKFYLCEKITRMHSLDSTPADSTIVLNGMLGGECAILHFTKRTN